MAPFKVKNETYFGYILEVEGNYSFTSAFTDVFLRHNSTIEA